MTVINTQSDAHSDVQTARDLALPKALPARGQHRYLSAERSESAGSALLQNGAGVSVEMHRKTLLASVSAVFTAPSCGVTPTRDIDEKFAGEPASRAVGLSVCRRLNDSLLRVW